MELHIGLAVFVVFIVWPILEALIGPKKREPESEPPKHEPLSGHFMYRDDPTRNPHRF